MPVAEQLKTLTGGVVPKASVNNALAILLFFITYKEVFIFQLRVAYALANALPHARNKDISEEALEELSFAKFAAVTSTPVWNCVLARFFFG